MSRVQLALNIADIDEAIACYSKLFGTEPAKVRPGYANFAIADPPLKLVLIEGANQTPGTLNHLGVEVPTTEEVSAAQARPSSEGLAAALRSSGPDSTEIVPAGEPGPWSRIQPRGKAGSTPATGATGCMEVLGGLAREEADWAAAETAGILQRSWVRADPAVPRRQMPELRKEPATHASAR